MSSDRALLLALILLGAEFVLYRAGVFDKLPALRSLTDRLARSGAPAYGDEEVKRTLIAALIEHHPSLGQPLLQVEIERLQLKPEMARPFTYMNSLSGTRQRTTDLHSPRNSRCVS